MKDTRPLIPVNCPQFCPPYRQFPVTLKLAFIYLNMKGAVHRLYYVRHPLKIHVTACMPEINPCYMRRVNNLIPIFVMLFSPEVFNQISYQSTLRMPVDKPCTDLIVNTEQV